MVTPSLVTNEFIDRIKGFLERNYGKITHTTMYSDRTIAVGFALGTKEMPKFRKTMPLIFNGKHIGTMHPVHHMRTLGDTTCCRHCPGIGTNHSEACKAGTIDLTKLKQQKAKWRAKMDSRYGNVLKPKPAGKENSVVVEKKSWADIVEEAE